MTTNNNKDNKKKIGITLDISNDDDRFAHEILSKFPRSKSAIIVNSIVYYAKNHPDIQKELNEAIQDVSVEKGFAYELLKSVITPELVSHIMKFSNQQLLTQEYIESLTNQFGADDKDTLVVEKDNEEVKEVEKEVDDFVIDDSTFEDFMNFLD